MSQFDFPRINFSGQCTINPGTANNNLLLPLVTYDPIQARVILPPRVYLSPDLLLLHKLDGLPIPENVILKYDDSQSPYVEIEPVNDRAKYVEWVKTPLGESHLDKAYHELYQMVMSKRTQKPLMGSVPASWNYYGGMEFGFDGVKVRSVAIADSISGQRLITSNDSDCPADIAAVLDATIDMENERGKNAAVMIDILPSLAMFSQVFCDSFQMKKNGSKLLKGKPLKGSLRFLNQTRIVNQEGVLGASGSFFSVIPVENLENAQASPILSLFQKYGQKDSSIKGVFIRYNLFEVQEDQAIDYQTWGAKANPAFATVVGSIAPWYEDDMKSITMGRQLVPEMPFLKQKKLASFVCQINTQLKTVSLDMLGSIPEHLVQQTPTPIYETYPLGELTLKLLEKDNQEIEIGTFTISPQHFSREQLMLSGGMIEISFKENHFLTVERLDSGFLALYRNAKSPEGAIMLMKESEYMIASDQAGLYANQGQMDEGYVSYGSKTKKEPCQIRVYQRGKPLTDNCTLTIMELKITGVGASASVKPFLVTEDFRDKQILSFPTDQAANAMYVFYPNPPPIISEDLVAEIYRTGFFVSLRVLPKKDFGRYLDPSHEEYPTSVTFEVLYKELLQTFDLIFPTASLITPFTEPYFQKGRRFIQQRMLPDNWAKASYMPSSRDMSEEQWRLFLRWLEGVDRDLTE
jgi:hypothetical protein